jgi:hypothetical protein
VSFLVHLVGAFVGSLLAMVALRAWERWRFPLRDVSLPGLRGVVLGAQPSGGSVGSAASSTFDRSPSTSAERSST